MKKYLISLFLLIVFTSSFACTTAVISGKYTKNGRPLLWKNRDTWAVNNKIMIFDDGKYKYTGLVNSTDSLGKYIWIGYNSAGFAIMNSASYNLNNDTIKQSGLEGALMKKALQTCATIDDFEELLKNMPKPTRLEANFGVIDANGGAAYFELANFEVFKFDANDPNIAPLGYIVRSNFSMAGIQGKGAGYIRYETADKVFRAAAQRDGISVSTVMRDATKNLTHALTGENLWNYVNIPSETTKMVWFYDYIPRKSSASSCVVEGVKEGESTEFMCMWSDIGWPLASVTVPVFLSKRNILPEILQYDANLKDAPLCNYALTLKKRCFSYEWGVSSKYYMNVNELLNADKTGIFQILTPLDKELIDKGEKRLEEWRTKGKIPEKELSEFYNSIDKKVILFYKQNFGL